MTGTKLAVSSKNIDYNLCRRDSNAEGKTCLFAFDLMSYLNGMLVTIGYLEF